MMKPVHSHELTTTPSKILPDSATAIQLSGDFSAFVENLNRLGTTFFQTRGDGGGLGKFLEFRDIFVDEERGLAADPENGMTMTLEELIAIHATAADGETGKMPGFDFEFATRTAGASVYSVPNFSEMSEFDRAVLDFQGKQISLDELESWRNRIGENFCMCPGCAKQGEYRSRNAKTHPAFRIFEELSETGMEIRARLMAPHVDFISWMVPENLLVTDGIVMVSDRNGAAVLHLNMRFLHAMQIRKTRIDDEEFAVLNLFDSRGERTFEFLAPDPDLVHIWKDICENTDLF